MKGTITLLSTHTSRMVYFNFHLFKFLCKTFDCLAFSNTIYLTYSVLLLLSNSQSSFVFTQLPPRIPSPPHSTLPPTFWSWTGTTRSTTSTLHGRAQGSSSTLGEPVLAYEY